MAKGGIRLSGLYAAIENTSITLTKEAAKRVVFELANLSPQYSGEFADNWVVRVGDERGIEATTPGKKPRPNKRQPRKKPKIPTVPSLYGSGQKAYTIGNTMEYRDIAMDLIPGRTEKGQTLSAPQDWYLNYLRNPNGLAKAIEYAVGSRPVQDSFVVPSRKGFVGRGGTLRS